MRKKLQKILALFMVLGILSNSAIQVVNAKEAELPVEIVPCTVFALEGSYLNNVRATTFSDTEITVSCSSSGMYVVITTSMTKYASLVGVKDITVDRLINGEWVTVATSTGGELTNTYGCTISFTYTGAVYNATYRITCTHYGNVDGYRELYHETESIKFIY